MPLFPPLLINADWRGKEVNTYGSFIAECSLGAFFSVESKGTKADFIEPLLFVFCFFIVQKFVDLEPFPLSPSSAVAIPGVAAAGCQYLGLLFSSNFWSNGVLEWDTRVDIFVHQRFCEP